MNVAALVKGLPLICFAVMGATASAETPTQCPVTYQQLENALRSSVHASGGRTKDTCRHHQRYRSVFG